MRLAASAFMTSSNRQITSKIGAVMETDQEDLVLWLHAYPLIGNDVNLTFEREHGAGKSDVSVITDYKTFKPEFSVGEAEFYGRKATVRLFSLPAFQATLKLSSPTISLRNCRGRVRLSAKSHSKRFLRQSCLSRVARRIQRTRPRRSSTFLAACARSTKFAAVARSRMPRGGGHCCHPFTAQRGFSGQLTGRGQSAISVRPHQGRL